MKNCYCPWTMSSLHILVCLVLGLIKCANSSEPIISPEERIIGGEFATEGEFPHQVMMVENHLCGGSIISESHILLAAHCVKDTYKAIKTYGHSPFLLRAKIKIKIFHGKIEVNPGLPPFFNSEDPHSGVLEIFMHPCYDFMNTEKTYYNDIAILKLSTPLKFGPKVNSIRIDENDVATNGTKVQAIGWGQTDRTNPQSIFGVLKKASLEIGLECEKQNDPYFTKLNTDGQICAFNPIEFACSGDSGGPMLCPDPDGTGTNILCGIISLATGETNNPEDKCTGPNIFTRVYHYRNWIKAIVTGQDLDSEEGCIGERMLFPEEAQVHVFIAEIVTPPPPPPKPKEPRTHPPIVEFTRKPNTLPPFPASKFKPNSDQSSGSKKFEIVNSGIYFIPILVHLLGGIFV